MGEDTIKDAAVAAGKVGDGMGKVAELGSNALATGRAFGGWLKDTLGTIPEDLLGLAGGDWLHHQRRRNLMALEANTEAVRARLGAGQITAPSVSVVMPLLQAAADESRPELQELWAALLANAMQPDGGRRVRRAFFDAVRQMEPPDAIVFLLYGQDVSTGSWTFMSEQFQRVKAQAAIRGVGPLDFGLSMAALHRLGLLTQTGVEASMSEFGKGLLSALAGVTEQ
ncbi:Abi-alpha family protein [Roseomonas sp. F4]